MTYCKKCGKQLEDNVDLCPACGTRQSTSGTTVKAVPVKQEKNKWIAFLLCAFFGLVGAHKFYEGKIGMGILYLCTLGLGSIGAIIDFFVLLCKPNPYYV